MRNPVLDSLRAAAILLVFCYHSEGAYFVSRFGWAGVDLFFVLSGFLVSGLLFREYQMTGQLRPGRFLLRRALKIYPQFYFFLAVTIGVAFWRRTPQPLVNALAEVSFVQNYFAGLWTHTWSLGVEEHFYLLLTLAMVLLARRGGDNPFRILPAAVMASGLCILGLRCLTLQLHPKITDPIHVFPSHLRIDSLMAGVLIAYWHHFEGDWLKDAMRRIHSWVPAFSILLLSPALVLTREHPFMVTIGFSMLALAFALLLLSVLYPVKPIQAPSQSVIGMAALGEVSYAFYLWHGPIIFYCEGLRFWAMEKGIPAPLHFEMAFGFAASLAVAIATTKLLELPILRLRDRYFPSIRTT